MVKKIYFLNFWSKLLIICLIPSAIILWFISEQKRTKEYSSEYFMSTAPDWKSLNIQYQDSVYNILDTEDYLYSVMNNKRILDLSANDTFRVDSVMFCKLKASIVVPQSHIDSFYKQKGMKAILKTYFDGDIPKYYNRNDTLLPKELLEVRYIINILVRNGFVVFRDCELGIPRLSRDHR